MHTMQLMAYLRLMTNWPANSALMLESMYNAITLDDLVNSVYDSVLDPFKSLVDSDDEESELTKLRENGLSYDNLMMSLGIFGISLAVICLIMLFYFLLQLCATRFSCCLKVKNMLRAKLFYSVWIRYMIESYLEMSHSCIFFLSISASFVASMESLGTIVQILLLVLFAVWPFFVTGFLKWNRRLLDNPDFKRKFISMYKGLKTDKMIALMYI